MFHRIVLCVGTYRARFGEWPGEVRLDLSLRQYVERFLAPDQLASFAARLQLTTATDVDMFEVCGSQGSLSWDDIDLDNEPTDSYFDEASTWLDYRR